MIKQKPPSTLEMVSGNLITEATLTAIAAIAGGPLAALLPALSNSLAAERQRMRVEESLAAMNELLVSQAARVKAMSDEQYKVVNESVLAILQTTQEQKLKLLRNAVANALSEDIGDARAASIISRIIRDISADEAAFLVRAFEFDGVQPIATTPGQSFEDNILRIDPKSDDYLNLSGLLSLGVLTPAESAWDSIGIMRFTSVAAKVIALLRTPDA